MADDHHIHSTAADSDKAGVGRGQFRWPPSVGDDELGEAEVLLDLLHPQRFRPGEQIFTERLPGDRVYVSQTGLVKVSKRGVGGRSNLVAFAGPGDIIGELSVFDPGPRTSTVTAVGQVDAGWLDRGAIRRWMAQRPTAAYLLLQLTPTQAPARSVRRPAGDRRACSGGTSIVRFCRTIRHGRRR
ncbi:cyclic nucleotide-binding domain-containing protein [Mycobacterium sp. GA-2829]|uniref:cyclic nucleotide-binding domain-containing protein n=1 Tax=Mycobacterium sp. GA-2829 TaxID=1772283 RepID=UPI00073FB1DD|nr:cyclic nucleotide-binding domain-containing protein [Mycobacterium sp. GA-2829]KUI36209.1 hypothetical protein AU194_15955 [Mycobacterium sp. GA-2829]